jgi:hypothetical protein
MKYYYLEPEVAGDLGESTVLDTAQHPPLVHKLHYVFDGWLGDNLLESFPCFIVTESAKEKLQLARFSGVKFEQVKVTTSEQFQGFYPNRQLPAFVWMQVEGIPGRDDFGIGQDFRLIVSDRALQILREIGIDHAKIEEL